VTKPHSDRAILIISDGGPASLAAGLLCEDAASSMLWVPPGLPSPRALRLDAVRRQADLLGFPVPAEAAQQSLEPPLATPRMLLDAAAEAGRRGCSRVVWPAHHGDDLDAMALAADQAALVTHLTRLEPGPAHAAASIHTPFLDLTDNQLIDLARDLDLPADACWWCEREGDGPCGRCDACRRWRPLTEAGRRTTAPVGGAA